MVQAMVARTRDDNRGLHRWNNSGALDPGQR